MPSKAPLYCSYIIVIFIFTHFLCKNTKKTPEEKINVRFYLPTQQAQSRILLFWHNLTAINVGEYGAASLYYKNCSWFPVISSEEHSPRRKCFSDFKIFMRAAAVGEKKMYKNHGTCQPLLFLFSRSLQRMVD